MLTILAAIFVFGVLVTVHELGHFVTAKLTGMRVEEFAIGFGPKIYQIRDGETLYTLRAIPLGGFNRIAGMELEDDQRDPRGYNNRPIPCRMLVILAGALMNFILPIFLFAGIFLFQGYDKPNNEPIIGVVVEEKAAYAAGLRAGDRILSINGQPVDKWMNVVHILRANGTNTAVIEAERHGKKNTYTMEPKFDEELGRPLVGIAPQLEHSNPGLFEAVGMGFKYTGMVILTMLDGLQRIIFGSAPADIAGPIGVATKAGEIAEEGVLPLINFVAFLSINLGVINLLPLPALDGGHFILLILEAVRGKALGPKAMGNIQMVGIALILAVTIFTTCKDIARF